jgi:hypothetical protein
LNRGKAIVATINVCGKGYRALSCLHSLVPKRASSRGSAVHSVAASQLQMFISVADSQNLFGARGRKR